MSSLLDSFTSPTIFPKANFDDHQSLLTKLNQLLPTADNEHIALQFLLDLALHIRLSQTTDCVFLDMMIKSDVTPLRIAKLNLLKVLNPGWHPILEKCEQQLELELNSSSSFSFRESSASAINEAENPDSPPQDITLSDRRQSPSCVQLWDLTTESNLPFSSGYNFSNDGLRSPVHIDNCAAGTDYYNTIPSAPLVGAVLSTCAGVRESVRTTSGEECEVPDFSDAPEYMMGPALSSPIYRTLPNECSSSTSTYSSLLPESHCPPFAKRNHSSLGCGLPSEPPDAIISLSEPSFALSSNVSATITDTPWFMNRAASESSSHTHTDYQMASLDDPNHVAVPSMAFTGGMMVQEGFDRTVLDQIYLSASSTSVSSSLANVDDNSNLPGTSKVLPEGHGERITATSRVQRKKRTRRVFERPPGLPLGPWNPADMGPLPETASLKKPRRVRRAPTKQYLSSSQLGLSGKVSCPKCGMIMLAKSLDRHMERHDNWGADGEYCAHLYCRYCLTPYCRMDLLVRHQKTDAQCVMLQYDTYWEERKPYLEKQIQIWTESAGRV